MTLRENCAGIGRDTFFFTLPLGGGSPPLPRHSPPRACLALHRMRRLQKDLCKPPAGTENCDRLKIDGISRGPKKRKAGEREKERERTRAHTATTENEKQGDVGKWSPSALANHPAEE